jgi:hypothetical protein
MNHGGEIKLLAARMLHRDWKLPNIVEWTARNAPQQNSPAEVGFTTMSGRARAMLEDANIPENLRLLLMPEAVRTATSTQHMLGLTILSFKEQSNKAVPKYVIICIDRSCIRIDTTRDE